MISLYIDDLQSIQIGDRLRYPLKPIMPYVQPHQLIVIRHMLRTLMSLITHLLQLIMSQAQLSQLRQSQHIHRQLCQQIMAQVQRLQLVQLCDQTAYRLDLVMTEVQNEQELGHRG